MGQTKLVQKRQPTISLVKPFQATIVNLLHYNVP